jgi:hypothetical protein
MRRVVAAIAGTMLCATISGAQALSKRSFEPSTAEQSHAKGPFDVLAVAPEFFRSENWCKDTGTLCWTDPKTRQFLNGIRFIGEPNTGGLSQNGDNQVETSSLIGTVKAGLEFNLIGAVIAAQFSFIPKSTVTLDSDSELVTSNRLTNPDRKMGVNSGYTLGFSLIDGIIAVGIGRLNMDTRRITSPTPQEKQLKFFFFNIQPISTIRGLISGTK